MKKASITILIALTLTLNACQPSPIDPMKVDILALETEQQKQSYAMGANMGQIVKSKITSEEKLGIEYDQHLIAKGFIAALQNQSQLKEEQIQLITRNVETLVVQKRDELQKKMAEENKAKGLEFLTKNAKRAGIVVTDSGLQYEVLKKGKGSKPRATDTVKVHYLGKLLDGTVFESSYSRDSPAIFPLNRVIKGWIEGLQLMNVGAKYKFYVPSDLANGARSTDKVVSHSSLIFEVELLEITETAKPFSR